MKPQILLFLVCGAFAVAAYFLFEVLLFRLSCSLAKLPRPTFAKSVGIVFTVFFITLFTQGALGAVVTEAYLAGGFPLWEAGVVVFCVGLPIHMVVCAALHAKMMGLPLTDGVAVWVIEKSIKLGVLLVSGMAVGLVLLLGRG